MEDSLIGLEDAVAALRRAWSGGTGKADAAGPASELDRAGLVAVNHALAAVGRRLDTVRAQVSAEIEHESRPELGPDSLAKQQGFRNCTALIAATGGIGAGDAKRLVCVGKAVAPRSTLTGEPLPPKHPHVAAGMAAGRLGQLAAALIVGMLDKVALRSSPGDRDQVEQTLVERAPGLSLDQLRKLITHAEAWLDPDGVEPAERDRRGERSLRLFERDGFVYVDGKLDAVSGASLKTAIDALVTAGFRQSRNDVTCGDDDALRPSVAQLQADALIQLAEHALGCQHSDLPLSGATVVVRMSLDALTDGVGLAEIDGITQPISPASARRYAAAAGIIPAVLGGDSEIVDWGRKKRLFTLAQRLALVERDGGCAMCNLPPGMTKAHHLNWWLRDHGSTNLDEGVLLCESCHHRIHDNGWDIRIEGRGVEARVWFIPPPTVDPGRTPRLGGRARFCYQAA
ncbi:HNH endonuclease signature motif containing protein [Microbacterium kribbense]|uniref:HNH endonuclease signature motif containing protein n=1 Tax=Microbacterium kribbense TaxID=433645 RepID=A0ABP7G218_9MICO